MILRLTRSVLNFLSPVLFHSVNQCYKCVWFLLQLHYSHIESGISSSSFCSCSIIPSFSCHHSDVTLVHVFIILYPTYCGRCCCSKPLQLFPTAALPVMTLLVGELYMPPPVNSDSVVYGLLWLRKCEWKLLKSIFPPNLTAPTTF